MLIVDLYGWPLIRAGSGAPTVDKVKRTAGRGRASFQVRSGLHIGTVVKHTVNKRLREVVHPLSHGNLDQAMQLLQRSEARAGVQSVSARQS